MLLKLIVVWTLVQFIEGHFISPNVMGKTLKIHPLTIIFILLSVLLGIVGVILGIPGYAILKVLVSHYSYYLNVVITSIMVMIQENMKLKRRN